MAREISDYDRKYKEDLERAQALSLESLALEQFKNKRLQELDNVSRNKNTTVSRASSMTETDSSYLKYDRQQSKSRPRPGTSSGSLNSSLIAPPPTSHRKNSTSSAESPDLISFTSPPTSADSIIEFCNLQNYSNKSITTFPSHATMIQPFSASPQMSSFISNSGSPLVQQPWFPSPNSTNGNNYSPSSNLIHSLGNSTPIYNSPNSFSSASPIPVPTLPPKNRHPTPPPLIIPSSRRSTPSLKHSKTIAPNLIDLAPRPADDRNSVRVSILQEFDPILSIFESHPTFRTTSPDCGDDSASVCDSVYDEYDPYDIYTGSGNNSLADPLYAAVVKSENAPQSPVPPLPPRAHLTLNRNNNSMLGKLDLLDTIVKVEDVDGDSRDSDLRAFFKMVYDVRNLYRYNDPNTNMGLVINAMVNFQYPENTSIKLCVYPDFEGADITKPINFTCDVNCSIEHVTLQLTCELEAPSNDKYTLKVWGCNEYLAPTTFLSEYEYVHSCIKLEEDIVLTLIPDSKIDRSFARTLQDDTRDRHLTFEAVIPNETVTHISYEKVLILLDAIEKEMKELVEAAVQLEKCTSPSVLPSLQPQKVAQSVRYIVKLMGNLPTPDIIDAVATLQNACISFSQQRETLTLSGEISSNCNRIRLAVVSLIEMYSQAFKVDFEIKKPMVTTEPTRYVPDISDALVVRVCTLYRPPPDWRHDLYMVAAQIYHGMRPVGHPVLSQVVPKIEKDTSWPSRVLFDHWFQMDDIPISSLARESRLRIVVYGRTVETPDGNDSKDKPIKYKQEEIGWAAFQFFNYEGVMVQGNQILSIWPRESQYLHGSPPAAGTHPVQDHPMLDIQITGFSRIEFPPVPPELTTNVIKGDFNSLDKQTQEQLESITEQDMLQKLPSELREVLWEKRHYLHHIPEALPKVLLAAHSWEYASLPDLHGMLHTWEALKPIEALQLLLPTFPDQEVRKMAVRWIGKFSNDELIDYIPQLVVALRHESYENSALAQFLLDRALRSPRFAHHLFWLLSHTLPGSIPQNSSSDHNEREEIVISEVRHHRRMKLMLRALLAICGQALGECFLSQQLLVKDLNEIADKVKQTKESHRVTVMQNSLNTINANLNDGASSLPLSPTLRVSGVQVRSCYYFPSNTLPLKIDFLAPDGSVIPVIYKVGDDLQQDMLTLQMVRLMDKLWRSSGLDLKMVAFTCVPTGKRKGMIEMVSKADTLRKIQVEHGLTGSFKDKPIAEWLAKHNPSELEYGRAVENFTASCAGYCVVTYILGICDRHNDNIMLKTSGHLFHIDFGKFLGDAQMFGNFKRDRAPFVLTSDMAYVINGGDRPSEKFHKFVDLCCQAFNIIRNNCNLFLYLFTLMESSGICGMSPESVTYLHRVLLPSMSNPEAAACFARLIENSLKSWFTPFNFFLHNLAQLKFSNDHNKDSLLSFVPKTYTLNSDGRLVHVKVVNFQKRYDPDKYYVYILLVYRENNKSAMEIQRTYREFCELHQKLCIYFPLAKLHSLSNGLHMGRANIKQVAKKRYLEIASFITSLFKCADEIAHSDLVYTFFHPLLRDQQAPEDYLKKDRKADVKTNSGRLNGQLKISFQYSKEVFTVVVYHLRGLSLLANGQEPSTYVKVYLLPDENKSTKRKTKVVKRNCHPSFMEMIEYRIPLSKLSERYLQASVYNYDLFQENEFLGGVKLELCRFSLTKETVEWYPLVNLSR